MTGVEFLKHVKNECKEKKVKLILEKKKAIKYPDGGFGIPGYFSTDPDALYCATKNENFLETLVHETCHMDQWSSKDKLFMFSDKQHDDVIFDKWLMGKKYSNIEINNVINRIQKIEIDAEKRAVEKIKKFKLPIDVKTYIKQSNVYILLYTFIKDKRQWPDIEPWAFKKLVNIMPSVFMKDYSKLSNKQTELFEMCYKKKK